MRDILPILKNRREFDKQKSNGMFVDELFGNESSPILMYGIDGGGYMEYNQSVSEEEDQKSKKKAITNLAKIDVEFQIQEMSGFKIATANHEYAAEKLLDKGFMRKLAHGLGSKSIVVGIPMKGFLAAVVKGKGEPNLYGAIVQQYQNAQTYPISDALYYVVDGEIVMMGGNGLGGSSKDQNQVFEIVGKNDDNGKLGFIVKVGNKNEDELANQIQSGFQNVLLQGMKDAKNLNGKIDFHISPQINQLTNSLDVRVKKMAKNITERGALQLLTGLSGKDVKVRFFYGDDKLIAETTKTTPVQATGNVNAAKPSSKSESDPSSTQMAAEKKPWWKFW